MSQGKMKDSSNILKFVYNDNYLNRCLVCFVKVQFTNPIL